MIGVSGVRRLGGRGTASRQTLGQLLRFLLGSAAGLTVDLVVFAVAVQAGAPPWAANTLSAACAVVVVYLLATRYAFATDRTPGGFLRFVGWYVVSILLFSAFIELLYAGTGWPPFICKLVSLPPSFAANFLASRALLQRRAAGGTVGPAPGSAVLRDAKVE